MHLDGQPLWHPDVMGVGHHLLHTLDVAKTRSYTGHCHMRWMVEATVPRNVRMNALIWGWCTLQESEGGS